MQKKNLSIHSENILPIIKKWLYSDKDIFIRELVSNACDALNKVRIIQGEETGLKVSLTLDKSKKTLTISDTGIGMTAEEVEKYIAQIAFSGAEEFVAKYKSQTDKDPIIGHFGLGFYSAYMVASKVEIQTRSYTGADPVFWSCDGSSSYEIGPGSRQERGTDIILHLEDLEYLEEFKIRELLNRYCSFMPFPIDLGGQAIGNQPPLWVKAPSDCTENDYLAFYRKLFPMDPDPIFWIHLNVDYPFNLKGILYFPKMHRKFDANESAIKLFCNRVFVSDNCKDILPDYLMVLRGALDSPDIPLNVSRSYLQVDQNVKQLSAHISKKISDRLNQLYKSDREKYISYWPELEMVVKLGLLQDEKFYEKIKDVLIWKTSEGNWSTAAEVLERAKEKKLVYASHEQNSLVLDLYKKKGVEILFAPAPIDTPVIQQLEERLSVPFQRIDGALNEALLDPEREKTLLNAEGKSEAALVAEFVRGALNEQQLEVEAKSLASDALPGLIVLDENQRRLRDYISLTQGKREKGLGPKKFVINTNSKLIQSMTRLTAKQPEVAKEIAQGIYDLSMLAQRELDPADLAKVVTRQTEVLEKLANLLV